MSIAAAIALDVGSASSAFKIQIASHKAAMGMFVLQVSAVTVFAMVKKRMLIVEEASARLVKREMHASSDRIVSVWNAPMVYAVRGHARKG